MPASSFSAYRSVPEDGCLGEGLGWRRGGGREVKEKKEKEEKQEEVKEKEEKEEEGAVACV